MLKIIQEDSVEDFVKYIKTIKTTPVILQGFCRDSCLLGSINITKYLVDVMKINPAVKKNGDKSHSTIYMLKEKIYSVPNHEKSIFYYSLIIFLSTNSTYIPIGDEEDIDLETHLKNNQHYIDMKKEYKERIDSLKRAIILEKL